MSQQTSVNVENQNKITVAPPRGEFVSQKYFHTSNKHANFGSISGEFLDGCGSRAKQTGGSGPCTMVRRDLNKPPREKFMKFLQNSGINLRDSCVGLRYIARLQEEQSTGQPDGPLLVDGTFNVWLLKKKGNSNFMVVVLRFSSRSRTWCGESYTLSVTTLPTIGRFRLFCGVPQAHVDASVDEASVAA